MKLPCFLIALIWFSFPGAAASAETLVIHPDPCPALADAPKIITMAGVEAIDLNPGRAALDHVLVLYPVRVKGWASARLLARFDVEGEPLRRPAGRSCR